MLRKNCSVWRRAARAARSASRSLHASEIDDRRLTARCRVVSFVACLSGGSEWAPNLRLQLSPPGSGAAAEPPRPNTSVAASCRLQFARRRWQYARQPACRCDFGTRALAAQFSVRPVRRTTYRKHREPQTSTSLSASVPMCGRCGATLRVPQPLRLTKNTRAWTSGLASEREATNVSPMPRKNFSVWRRAARAARSASPAALRTRDRRSAADGTVQRGIACCLFEWWVRGGRRTCR